MHKNLRSMPLASDWGGQSLKKATVKYYWQGGANGAENDWNNPLNWYNRQVPGWFDEVVISGKHAVRNCFPVLEIFANDIAQLIVEQGGRLVIAGSGRLSIDGLGKKSLGIWNEGEIFINGELTILRTTHASVRNKGLIHNAGSLGMDKKDGRSILEAKESSFINEGELLFL